MNLESLLPLLQGLTVAVLIWFGSRVVTVSETDAVHDWRIKALEDK